MREAIRRRLASEEGISLVEIMVAFAVLALILLGFAATLTSSLHAIVGNESRTKANALANDYLENLQHEPWDEIEDKADDEETDVATEGPYTVTTDFAWADDLSVAGSDDYVEFTVTIDWEDLGVLRTVTHEARRSPPARPVLEDQRAAVRSIRVDPEIGYLRSSGTERAKLIKGVEFDDDGNVVTTSVTGASITVRTTLPVSSVKAHFTDRNGNPQVAVLSEQNAPENTEWHVPGNHTNWRYQNGDNTFRIEITSDDGDIEATKVVRYVFEDVEPIAVPQAAPETVCVDDTGAGEESVQLTVELQGLTIDDLVEVAGAGLDAGQTWLAEYTGSNATGSLFEFVLPEGHQYPEDEDTATVAMIGVRAFDGASNVGHDDPADDSPAEVELELLREGDEGYDDECGEP